MRDNLSTELKKTSNIKPFIQGCIDAQSVSNDGEKTLTELNRYLNNFSAYCDKCGIESVDTIDLEFLHKFLENRCKNSGPSLKKAVVWSLRKFGNYLLLINAIKDNPYRKLRHPKFHPRAELPKYLSESQVRTLLEYGARNLDLQSFSILSLMVTTGLRTNEVVSLKRKNVSLDKLYFKVKVKGGWIKHTALCEPTAKILSDYLSTKDDHCEPLFVNKKHRPISESFLRGIIRNAGEKAGLSISLTPNIIRHTFATHAADRNGKVITKALMGHRLLKTTEVYTHLSPRHFRALMNLHPYLNK